MFFLRSVATRALSTRVASQIFLTQSRHATHLLPRITSSIYLSNSPSILKRLASTEARQRDDPDPSEDLIERRAQNDRLARDPVQPESTSAAEFDASDIQAVEAREIQQPRSGESVGRSSPAPSTQPQREYIENNRPSKELYVGNLYFDVTEDDMRREFSRFGTITDLRIVKDPQGLSKGFAYVTFIDQVDATSCLEALNQTNFEGRRLSIQYRRPRTLDQIQREKRMLRSDGPAPPTKTLYIGNMSFDLSDQDLSKLFAGVKNVIDVRVAIDRRTGHPRGFAHADFSDIESAEQAYQKLNGKEVYGRKLRCDFSSPAVRVRERGGIE